MGFLRQIFGIKSKTQKLTVKDINYETGLKGDADAIAVLAKVDISYTTKIGLVRGCTDAYSAGRPQNLQTFIASYLEFKRENGKLTDILTGKNGIDEGLVSLAIHPTTLLAEKSTDAKGCLETLSAPLPPFYKSAFLDLVLRNAAAEGSWPVVEAALALGADPNTGHGRPLLNAFSDKHTRVISILFAHGAEIEKISSSEFTYAQQQELTALYNKLTGKQPTNPPEPVPDAPPPESPKGGTSGFRL